MAVDRRQFLEWAMLSGLLPATSAMAEKFGVSTDLNTPRLLVVMLRGACDTDSMLYQYNNSFYYDSRPNIAIGRNGIGDESLKVDDTWAMHPSLLPLAPLLQKKELAFVPLSGSDDTSRSHFQAQEIMEAGIPVSQKIGSNAGWLNRVVHEMKRQLPKNSGFGGTNFGRPSTLICRGPEDMPDLSLGSNKGKLTGLENKADVLMKLYDEAGYTERLMSVTDRRIQLMQERALGKNHGAQFNSSDDVVNRFRQIGRLMRQGGGFSVGFVDVNGWDTHVGQGADSGPLASKFRQLALGLDAFRTGVAEAWGQTQVVVMSEFGRTFRENGNRGTDHGRGTTLILLSGKKFPNSVLGNQIVYGQNTLNENRDWPVLNEYRGWVAQWVLPSFGLSRNISNQLMYLV